MFPLGHAYRVAVELNNDIHEKIAGRAILPDHDAGILGQLIYRGRHSDHVEIGTLFGGSAILAALVKKHFKLHGNIYCIDPFQFRPSFHNDMLVNENNVYNVFKMNAKAFEVEDMINIIPKPSYPWPLDEGKTFGTAFVDGDHWNAMPLLDWNNLKEVVSYAMAFDDYAREKPEVIKAFLVACRDPEWIPVCISGMIAIIRRRQ